MADIKKTSGMNARLQRPVKPPPPPVGEGGVGAVNTPRSDAIR